MGLGSAFYPLRQPVAPEVSGGNCSGSCRAGTGLQSTGNWDLFMTNDATRAADKLSALIAEIEAEAFACGQADARKELLDILHAGGRPAAPASAAVEEDGSPVPDKQPVRDAEGALDETSIPDARTPESEVAADEDRGTLDPVRWGGSKHDCRDGEILPLRR